MVSKQTVITRKVIRGGSGGGGGGGGGGRGGGGGGDGGGRGRSGEQQAERVGDVVAQQLDGQLRTVGAHDRQHPHHHDERGARQHGRRRHQQLLSQKK